jgi:hypothetical protein
MIVVENSCMLLNYAYSVIASDVKVKEKCVFCSLVEKGVTDIFNFFTFLHL